jgi:hypothetical protein
MLDEEESPSPMQCPSSCLISPSPSFFFLGSSRVSLRSCPSALSPTLLAEQAGESVSPSMAALVACQVCAPLLPTPPPHPLNPAKGSVTLDATTADDVSKELAFIAKVNSSIHGMGILRLQPIRREKRRFQVQSIRQRMRETLCLSHSVDQAGAVLWGGYIPPTAPAEKGEAADHPELEGEFFCWRAIAARLRGRREGTRGGLHTEVRLKEN